NRFRRKSAIHSPASECGRDPNRARATRVLRINLPSRSRHGRLQAAQAELHRMKLRAVVICASLATAAACPVLTAAAAADTAAPGQARTAAGPPVPYSDPASRAALA